MIQSYFHNNNYQHTNVHRDDDDDFNSANKSKRTRLNEDPEVELELQKVRANPSKYPAVSLLIMPSMICFHSHTITSKCNEEIVHFDTKLTPLES